MDNYERPINYKDRISLSKLDIETLKYMRDKVKERNDQYGSSRPVRYSKSGNTDILGQQSSPAMNDKRQSQSYYRLICDVIYEKENNNENKSNIKKFESFINENNDDVDNDDDRTELQKRFEEETPSIIGTHGKEYLKTYCSWLEFQLEKGVYNEEDLKDFGLFLGSNLKKNRNILIDDLFDEWKNP